MKFVIGLGNPGAQYQHHRHNVGFMIIDQLANVLGLDQKWQHHAKAKSLVVKQGDLLLIKPQDFMNNSGLVARQVINFYERQFRPESVIVIHDDLDLALGEFKIQLGKGPKAHNGLIDLDRHLGTANYWHVRIGVDNRTQAMAGVSGADYVLANFTTEEQQVLQSISQKLIDQLKELIEKQV